MSPDRSRGGGGTWPENGHELRKELVTFAGEFDVLYDRKK